MPQRQGSAMRRRYPNLLGHGAKQYHVKLTQHALS